jgi:hypothetical protein
MKKLTVAQFSDWLNKYPSVMMDDDLVDYQEFEKDVQEAVIIQDFDEECPNTLLEIDENVSSIILNADNSVTVAQAVDIGSNGIYHFKPLSLALDESSYLDKKEMIAGIIFEDNDLSEDYERPSEGECHRLAEIILERLGNINTDMPSSNMGKVKVNIGYVVDMNDADMIEEAKSCVYEDLCNAVKHDELMSHIVVEQDASAKHSDIPDFLKEENEEW